MPVTLCSFSWSKQPGMQLLDHMVSTYLVFLRNRQTAFSLTVSFYSYISSIMRYLSLGILTNNKVSFHFSCSKSTCDYSHCVPNLSFIKDQEFWMSFHELLSNRCPLLVKCLFISFPHFLIELFLFLLSFDSFLYTLRLLSDVWLANNFSKFVASSHP